MSIAILLRCGRGGDEGEFAGAGRGGVSVPGAQARELPADAVHRDHAELGCVAVSLLVTEPEATGSGQHLLHSDQAARGTAPGAPQVRNQLRRRQVDIERLRLTRYP